MNIYVSSLSYDVTNDDLKAAFEEFGSVTSASVILDKFTQRSRGFGFVEMPEKEQAEKAISQLNGTTLVGRTINVAEAREREPRQGGYNRSGSSSFRNNDRSRSDSNRW